MNNTNYNFASEVIANSICEMMKLYKLDLTMEDKFDILTAITKLQNVVERIKNTT